MPKRKKRTMSRKQREKSTYQEKFAYLSKLEENQEFLTDADIEKLRILSKDKETGVRSDVAALLVCFDRIEAKEMLMRLAKDENGLVRTEAYDSLCVFPYMDVLMFLRRRMTVERYWLPRFYAILSWRDIVMDMELDFNVQISEVHKRLPYEKNDHCRLAYFEALYYFGQKDALNNILAFLECRRNLPLQCATLATLVAMPTEEHKKIIPHVKLLLSQYNPPSVRCRAEEMLQSFQVKGEEPKKIADA